MSQQLMDAWGNGYNAGVNAARSIAMIESYQEPPPAIELFPSVRDAVTPEPSLFLKWLDTIRSTLSSPR